MEKSQKVEYFKIISLNVKDDHPFGLYLDLIFQKIYFTNLSSKLFMLDSYSCLLADFSKKELPLINPLILKVLKAFFNTGPKLR